MKVRKSFEEDDSKQFNTLRMQGLKTVIDPHVFIYCIVHFTILGLCLSKLHTRGKEFLWNGSL
jgi:hypothetical protein